MVAVLSGLYARGEVLFGQVQLSNQSPLDYPIGVIRFYIKDQRTGRRTAAQEVELAPLFIAGDTTKVSAFGSTVLVVALNTFTLTDHHYLAIEIGEQNGGRKLCLKLKNRHLLRALQLPDSH
jgi:hypothetical protein